MAVLESIQVRRVYFELLGNKSSEDLKASCEIRAHFRSENDGVGIVLLVARFFDGHPSPPFRLEVGVEGRFRLGEGETPRALAEGAGPATLYPYLRDEIAHLTWRAGLTPVILPLLRLAQPVVVREDVN